MYKGEVESYLSDVDAYKDCLIREANSKIEETSSEFYSVIDKFNCSARGGKICFQDSVSRIKKIPRIEMRGVLVDRSSLMPLVIFPYL